MRAWVKFWDQVGFRDNVGVEFLHQIGFEFWDGGRGRLSRQVGLGFQDGSKVEFRDRGLDFEQS